MLTGPRKGRKIRVSDDAPVTIGRSFGRIRLHDTRCSKNHAEIVFDGDSWIFRDLGSANGTHINKTRVRGLIELEAGDMIQIGRILIKVREANSWGVRNISDEGDALAGHTIAPPKTITDEPAAAPPAQEQTITGETAFGDDLDLDALFEEFENDEDIAIPGSTPQAIAPAIPPASKPLKSDLNEETAAVDAIGDPTGDKIAGVNDNKPVEPTPEVKPSPNQPEDTADLIEIEDDAADKPGTTMVLPTETIAASAVTDRASLIAPPEMACPPMESQDTGEDSGIKALKAAATPMDAADSGLAQIDDDEAIGLASDDPVIPEALPAQDATEDQEPEATNEDLSDLILIDDKRGETPIAPPLAVSEAEDTAEEGEEPQAEAEAEVAHAPAVEAEEAAVEPAVEAAAEDAIDETATEAVKVEAIESPIDTTNDEEEAAPLVEPEAVVDDESVSELVDDAIEDESIGQDDAGDLEAEAHIAETAAPESHVEAPDVDEQDAEQDAEQEDLAHSQLDVAFIQQALADLEPQADVQADAPGDVDEIAAEIEDESDVAAAPADAFALDDSDRDSQTEALSPDDTDYDAPKAQALSVPTGSSEAVADELDADDAMEHQALRSAAELSTAFASQSTQPPAVPLPVQPLPGQNPVSIVAPEEPLSSRGPTPAKRADRQRLLKTAALIAVFVGLGALVIHYINPSLINKVTGRTSSSPPAEPGDSGPGSSDAPPDRTNPASAPNIPAQPGTTGLGHTNPQPSPDRLTPAPAVVLAGMPRQPDPFGDWPRVLGPRALSGRTTDDPNVTLPENPDLDPLPQPNVNPDTPIIMPNPGPTTPAITNPDPEQQTTDTSTDQTTDTTANQDPTTPADGDRLIFLVDCSGSLVDSLPQMLLWLDTATQSLAPGEQFTIIYFKNGNTQEILPTGFKPMSRSLREDLDSRWLNPDEIPISPSGRSAPDQAMRLALSYEPSDIYLLSDEAFGRETGSTSQDQAVEAIVNVIGDHEVRVHAVQFFYEDEAGTLQSIANAFGGTYEFIAETRHPDEPPIGLLEQLEDRDKMVAIPIFVLPPTRSDWIGNRGGSEARRRGGTKAIYRGGLVSLCESVTHRRKL